VSCQTLSPLLQTDAQFNLSPVMDLSPVAGNRVPAVNLWVRVQLRGVHLLGAAESCNTDTWLTVWEKELHFSDDSQHLLRVVEMSQAQKQYARHAKVCINDDYHG
jgi:hypothetical protein